MINNEQTPETLLRAGLRDQNEFNFLFFFSGAADYFFVEQQLYLLSTIYNIHNPIQNGHRGDS